MNYVYRRPFFPRRSVKFYPAVAVEGPTTYQDAVSEGTKAGDAYAHVATLTAAISEGLKAGESWAGNLVTAAQAAMGRSWGTVSPLRG